MTTQETTAAYGLDMRNAANVQHRCFDCLESSGGICDRHAGRCVSCGNDNVVERDHHQYADGVGAWWCDECGGTPPTQVGSL